MVVRLLALALGSALIAVGVLVGQEASMSTGWPPPASAFQPMPIVVPLFSTATIPPQSAVQFLNRTPPGTPAEASVTVRNRADVTATATMERPSVLTIEVDPGLTIQILPPNLVTRYDCASTVATPHIMVCSRLFPNPLAEVSFIAIAHVPRVVVEVALDLGERRPCIPEQNERTCTAARAGLWDGDPQAWATRGISDADARFAETLRLRAMAGDPVTLGGIARQMGVPYVKITRLRFVGIRPGQADEFIELTNLGGYTFGPTRYAFSISGRSGTEEVEVPPLPPGQSCRTFTAVRAETASCVEGIGSFGTIDLWPDADGIIELRFPLIGTLGERIQYSADPAHQPPPPNLQLVTPVAP